jgi:spore germination protein YaaH
MRTGTTRRTADTTKTRDSGSQAPATVPDKRHAFAGAGHGRDVTEASPWMYGLSSSGQIGTQYAPGQAASVADEIRRLRGAGKVIVPTIANITGGTFSYRDPAGHEHTVWFENAASSRATFNAARAARIAGVYPWMYGYEDSGTWSALGHVLPTSGPHALSTSKSVP